MKSFIGSERYNTVNANTYTNNVKMFWIDKSSNCTVLFDEF